MWSAGGVSFKSNVFGFFIFFYFYITYILTIQKLYTVRTINIFVIYFEIRTTIKNTKKMSILSFNVKYFNDYVFDRETYYFDIILTCEQELIIYVILINRAAFRILHCHQSLLHATVLFLNYEGTKKTRIKGHSSLFLHCTIGYCINKTKYI